MFANASLLQFLFDLTFCILDLLIIVLLLQFET